MSWSSTETPTRDDLGITRTERDAAVRLLSDLPRRSSDFATLVERYGKPAPALRHFGLMQWEAGRLDDAAALFRAGLSLEDGNADLWRDLAGVYEALSNDRGAEAAIRASLGFRPDVARSWLMLANLCSRTGRLDEARAAFTRSLERDPTLGEALFGLGLVHFQQANVPAAVDCLRRAVSNGYENATGFSTLGHVLYLTGDFAGCAEAFGAAMRLAPLDAGGRRRHARSSMLLAMIAGDVDGAIESYAVIAGDAAEDASIVIRDAFHQLSAYGHTAAAIALGRLRLAENPDDPTQRYLLQVLSGQPLTKAPVDYVETHFDGFADTFDSKLVQMLHYDVPALLTQLIAQSRTAFEEVLDLGCGTGLAAMPLATLGGRMTGVDLASRMLEVASKRGLYAELSKGEAVAYLADHQARFDLVFAADLLIYFGDLQPMFAAAAQAIKPGGVFAFSIESATEGTFTLLPSGRFAHSNAYVETLADRDFLVLARQPTMLRLEAGRPADGIMVVLSRRG